MLLLLYILCKPDHSARIFYVDLSEGKDGDSGDITTPFQTLTKALEVVNTRVERGILSDKIYLRIRVLAYK